MLSSWFDFILVYLLLVYYTVYYVPPPQIPAKLFKVKYLVPSSTWIRT